MPLRFPRSPKHIVILGLAAIGVTASHMPRHLVFVWEDLIRGSEGRGRL